MPRHLIHLVCGSTGAGKTTYAQKLADQIGGVLFCIDEWMSALYWMDRSNPITPAWALERVERCMTHIWTTAARVAARGTPCVLDLGFNQADVRAQYTALAESAGFSHQLHFVNVPIDERWRRVRKRNSEKGDTYQLAFDITREMFDFTETMWQPPTAAEMARGNGIWVVS